MEHQKLTSNDIRTVSRMRMFQNLPADDLQKIISTIHYEQFSPGSDIFKFKDARSCFIGVLSGWVIVYGHSPNGNLAVLNVLGRGETIGETALFLDGGLDVSLKSLDSCRLCIFEQAKINSLMARIPSLASGMIRAVSWQLRQANNEIVRLQTLSGEQRLALFLLESVDSHKNRCSISLPYNKMLIAKRLGMRPESLSRHFKLLRTFGVKVDNQKIFISDIDFLWSHLRASSGRH